MSLKQRAEKSAAKRQKKIILSSKEIVSRTEARFREKIEQISKDKQDWRTQTLSKSQAK